MFSLSPLHRPPLLKPPPPSLSSPPSQPPLPPLLFSPKHVRTPLHIKSISITAPKQTSTALDEPDPGSITQMPPLSDSHLLNIAIIGFGNFGQFIAKTLVSQGHTVIAYSKTDHSHEAHSLGVSFFLDPHDLCEQHPDVILLCTSILSTEKVLKSLPLQRFKRNTLFVDVLSVKEFAKKLFLDVLPSDFDILCTHPMFGPESAKLGWDGFCFVYDKVRIGNEESRATRCENFLDIFASQGCKMVEMSCHEHDMYAAESQFITHTVGRVLEMLKLESTPINTKGYESLLELVENTAGDSFDLFYGLFMYNKNALEMLKRFNVAFEELRKQLFDSLHDAVRKQLLGNGEKEQTRRVKYLDCNRNGAALAYASVAEWSQGAAQPYKYEAQSSDCIDENSKLKIGIVGFGNFGQFLARTFVRQGHTVLAYSRSDYSYEARKLGVSYFSNADDFCEEHPDVLLLCTSILSTEKVLQSLPVQRLKRSTLFVDVLSVKEFPRSLFLQHLPPDFDILCTHPMFGPESGKNGWNNLPFLFDKVRVGSDETRVTRCDQFLDTFAREGCRMVEMSCSEHDWHAAGSQFITHTTGRILEKLGLESTPINTKGYEILLNLVENTAGDSFDLYYGLFMYNVNAMEQLERLDLAVESLKKQIFGRLHGVIRRELFENAHKSQDSREEPQVAEVIQTDAVLSSSTGRLNIHNN